ncbi:hypothetical protein IAQ61_006798 [Plenodomus lingam]|uniref:Uncharacterized protein n=1 Tax=Leptosphaeria maculans (strain JN3 / isolate v23.1.3 / race Av1-4-5-6-7-8) TaxID=985895 RepID=E5ACL0_LEPMJ|nr:hypothetical protein LEMA_P009990.1 [Plenodomus lingam JN3]KAH9869590.1 hypothetical protein IAQ61_006798 [Plenodomus lingam]CBY02212.1 hypothetical protein LEMA_P009990.1 [Plenodomus lingam JN3]
MTFTSTSRPKRHASSLFHRSPSRPASEHSSEERLGQYPEVFQGTDAVTQNRRVALQRIIEVHDALELKQHFQAATSPTSACSSSSHRQRSGSSSSTSSDACIIDFSDLPFPDAEVRAFRYFVRRWDPSMPADPEFDQAIASAHHQFEEMAIKHFIRRVVFWNASEEAKEDMSRSVWRRRGRSKSQLSSMWNNERGRTEFSARDQLKEVTTQEGLAQLLWTLLHNRNISLNPGLKAECTDALKRMYGMKC